MPRRARIRAWLAGVGVSAAVLLAVVLLSATMARHASPVSRYDAAVLADHPAAFWDMRAAGRTEPDLTGHGHTGRYRRGAPAHARLPDGEQAAAFTGTGEYLSVPSSAAFSISTTKHLTWETWIQPRLLHFTRANDPSGAGYVDWMGKCENYAPNCEWEARMYSSVNGEGRCDRLSAYVFNPNAGLGGSADWQPNCNLLKGGQWLYVVGEYQTQSTPSDCRSAYPGTINIWVNGVAWNPFYHSPTGCMSAYHTKPRHGNSPLDIGTMAFDTWFPGTVGKVAIYDSLLSQAQIRAHFAAMTGVRPSGGCANSCTIPVPTP